MRAISIHVPERAYREFKSVAARSGRPVAELIREAMLGYLARELETRRSLLDLPPHRSGRLRGRWTRLEIMDEMRGR